MPRTAATFYFDFISPYAYLAWHRLPKLVAAHELELELVPILFAGLLNHYGQLGPAEVEPKREFVFRQAFRRGHRLGLRLSPPPGHPFNPLLALRVASIAEDLKHQQQVITALFEATWGGGPGIHTPALVCQALDNAGLDGAALVAKATTPEGKLRLRAATDTAIKKGVFGVPTIFTGGEVFWGDDSIAEDLPVCLRGEDPLDHELLAKWSHTEPVAVRPGSKR
ncbi:MAG: 2-hydroxychromene-2-carboxylate isomerase [Nannocystaceae bacterium]